MILKKIFFKLKLYVIVFFNYFEYFIHVGQTKHQLPILIICVKVILYKYFVLYYFCKISLNVKKFKN